MVLKFSKYQGAGNDFIIIDDRSKSFNTNNSDFIQNLCHRKFGIGADGLILLRNHTDYDFEMVYFNADGKLGSMCGNGGRCIVDFAKCLGVFSSECIFLASDGPHVAYWNDSAISLKMSDVKEIELNDDFAFMDTGSPHYIKLVNKLNEMNVYEEGKKIRYNSRFKDEGTNVNFVQNIEGVYHLRTYERGVENETLACGTGAVASAIALHNWNIVKQQKVRLKAIGGIIDVTFIFENGIYRDVFLTGPAQQIFNGEIKC